MKRARVLTFRYVGALIAIAALLVIGQTLVQLALDRQLGDARVVNLAGRQRMLSQRLCMLMLELDGEQREHTRAELGRVADEWERAQYELVHGGARIGEIANTPEVRALLDAIASDQRAMLAAARDALGTSGPAAPFAREAISHQEAFLEGMDRTVAAYEREARARVTALRRTELALLAVVLLVLALEGLFVFRPAVHALRAYIAQRQAIVQALPDRLVLLSTNGTCIDVRDDGDPPAPIALPEGLVASWLPAARDTLATGSPSRVEFREGDARELEGRMVPFAPDRVLVVIRDVTDLSRLERQLLQVSDRELVRLSQDLHDGLGQHLVGIASLAKTLRREIAASPHEARVDEIHRLLGEAIAQTRDLARNLSPPVLEHDGLAAALRELAAHTERVFGVACRLNCERPLELPLASRAHLHRIAREAVLNAAKHAHATAIEIELRGDERSWSLAVRDDGVGIADNTGDGMGLHLMQYRAKMLGASLHVARAEARGTVVSCSLEQAV